MNRDTPAGKASVKHLCEVFGVSRQAYHKALQTPAIAPVGALAWRPSAAESVGLNICAEGDQKKPLRDVFCSLSGH